MNISDIDQFLFDIQNHHNLNRCLYSVYEDTLFTILRFVCQARVIDISSPLTRDQEVEKEITNAVRIAIEHGFSVLCNRWRIMERYKDFKLSQKNLHEKFMFVVTYLLSNIYVTLQGFQVSDMGTFSLYAPILTEYLDL